MPVLFAANAGRVVALPDPAAIGLISGVQVEGWGGFPALRAVITRVLVAQQGNYQFSHMLGGLVYAYVFGDRMGDVQISGLAFDRDCNSAGGQPLGIQAVAAYYTQNRLAGRASPLKIVIGTGPPMNCLLLKMSGDLVDPQTRVFQFNLQLALIPTVVERNRRNRVQQGFGAGQASRDNRGNQTAQPTTIPSQESQNFAGNSSQNFAAQDAAFTRPDSSTNFAAAPTGFVNGPAGSTNVGGDILFSSNRPSQASGQFGYVGNQGLGSFDNGNGNIQDWSEAQ